MKFSGGNNFSVDLCFINFFSMKINEKKSVTIKIKYMSPFCVEN